MNLDVRWLARLGVDQGLFTRADCLKLRRSLGEGVELMDFAQRLIDDGIVEDVEKLEQLAGAAMAHAQQQGEPAVDAFADTPADATDYPVGNISLGSPGVPLPTFDFASLDMWTDLQLAEAVGELLKAGARFGASDLHLSAGSRPFLRKHREIVPLAEWPLTAQHAHRLNTVLLSAHQRHVFDERRDLDYALAIGPSNRYRVNLMVHKQGVAGSYRMVPTRIPRLDDIGLRNVDVVRRLLTYHNGLILVTGPVGAGKTTTLSALVAELNETREDHIITIEDPIEIVQASRRCNVTQREVGPHTKSFATALKGALREDPDVIVVGELRDLETIEMAVTAAETGHLVIGTMHTSDAATTLNRLLDVFPSSQQSQIRGSVAESLRGILCQRLLPSTEGGLVLASEILVANAAVANLIRDGKTQGLRNVIETGIRDGMCLMENVIFDLYQRGKITPETARAQINSRILKSKIPA
jgi:twitching motility protein PilT